MVGKLLLASSSVTLPPLQVKEIRFFYPLPIFIVMVPLQLIVTANKIFTSYYWKYSYVAEPLLRYIFSVVAIAMLKRFKKSLLKS